VITATRFHDFSCGHRVVGHEGKCRHLHGHNYRVHFTVRPVRALDTVGRVLDFSAIKDRLCEWLEKNWDHKMLIWDQDPMLAGLLVLDQESIVVVPFNPTAEKMGEYLLRIVGNEMLRDTHTQLIRVVVEETRKCSATAEYIMGDDNGE
jgi:6-pyruvoyltetrahydropterin/6-carboxytetrahydropterin synthase